MSPAPRARHAVAGSAAAGVAGFDLLADFGREPLAMVTQASAIMLRGFEAMRTIQQQAARQASARHAAAAAQLRRTGAAADLLMIPFGLLQDDLQGAARYWQDLAASAMETQTELMACTGHLCNADAALEAASAVDALDAIPGVTRLFAPRTQEPARRRAKS